MLIGELVQKSGLSRDTIRFYEKQGLIAVGRKDRRPNNYKEYSQQVLRRLLLIQKIKTFGFTLNETADLLSLIDTNEATCAVVSEKAMNKITLIEQKIAELLELKQILTSTIEQCPSNYNLPEYQTNCPTISHL